MRAPATPRAETIGLIAARSLAKPQPATVLAAFERSLYLETGDGPVAIVAADLHDGPLNIRLDIRGMTGLAIQPGETWIVETSRLRRDGDLTIDLEAASVWEPITPRGSVDRRKLRSGVDRLRRRLRQMTLPEDGLIRLTAERSAPANAVERAAAPILARLSASIEAAFRDMPRADVADVTGVLGLGPGLTPSGDDLLCGLLITCRRLGEAATADSLAAAVDALAPGATNSISRAHLAAAGQGFGAAPLHVLLDAILNDDHLGLDEALDAAAKIGHSSGLDAIAGMLMTATVWLQAGDTVAIA